MRSKYNLSVIVIGNQPDPDSARSFNNEKWK